MGTRTVAIAMWSVFSLTLIAFAWIIIVFYGSDASAQTTLVGPQTIWQRAWEIVERAGPIASLLFLELGALIGVVAYLVRRDQRREKEHARTYTDMVARQEGNITLSRMAVDSCTAAINRLADSVERDHAEAQRHRALVEERLRSVGHRIETVDESLRRRS